MAARVLTVLTDITQRRNAEEMLSAAKRAAEAANAAKSDFLANMSHELRTPLNAVIGFAELMKKEIGPAGSEAHREYCDYIVSGGQHLLSIISDVLDMAQIEAGKMQLREAPVDLQGLLNDAVRLVRATAEENGARVTLEKLVDMPLLLVDEAKFRQVLVNITDNALKYSHRGGTVTVGASVADDGRVLIDISDEGVGMSDIDIEVAFSRFGRVGPAVLSHPGTGLGLPLSVDLVRLHGGDLAIDSRPGGGTRVLITLPPERVIRDAEPFERSRAGATA